MLITLSLRLQPKLTKIVKQVLFFFFVFVCNMPTVYATSVSILARSCDFSSCLILWSKMSHTIFGAHFIRIRFSNQSHQINTHFDINDLRSHNVFTFTDQVNWFLTSTDVNIKVSFIELTQQCTGTHEHALRHIHTGCVQFLQCTYTSGFFFSFRFLVWCTIALIMQQTFDLFALMTYYILLSIICIQFN